MAKKVLIVDDDQEMLKILKKDLEKYSRTFSVLAAEDGLAAVEVLKKNNISLVITDLEMPQMDGLALLNHLKERYPDIPAIVITDSSMPEEQKLAREKGAAGYVEKPFIIEDLARKIVTVLKKEGDGGILHGIAPGTFLQLVEMEEKTCTIRLTDDKSGKQGVLFFKNGELLQGRINELQGRDAAYEILGWEEATLSIQESCSLKENKVQADLQALLLEAMRLKDEVDEQEEPEIVIELADEEPEFEIDAKAAPEIVMELEEEKSSPDITTVVKEPSPTITTTIKKPSPKRATPKVGDQKTQAPAKEDTDEDLYRGRRTLDTIGDLKESFFGSAFVKLMFKTFFLVVMIGIAGISYLYFTMETDKDLLKQISQAKSLIRSQQETLFQIDKEIQRLFTEKEDHFKNNESKIVLMELDLKISELEEKLEKIDAETKNQKKTLEDHQARLEVMKRKPIFDRMLERIKND
ncbi:MAG: response regulator [Deltaproteobacteria bacterium]|nr:response regulator [Deltaproteobacteria bacterium]